MPIKVLSDEMASKIAAGEVVERPASVVKELIENAIDAGATTINIDVREGGRQLIQVADDGEGIPPDQLETAFLRHATSKMQSAADLEAIKTLGFRGEALAAIAAVSQVTAVSRAKGESAGLRLALEGGRKTSRETVGAPQGTVIAVAKLFFNTPARLKFLKAVTTERRAIDEYVTRFALAYPAIRYRLTHDNRITFQSTGSGKLADVLAAIHGPEMAGQLIAIGEAGAEKRGDSEVIVSGYVGPPAVNWSNRNQITLFANGRWIKDNRLSYAVIQAYHTLLPTGRYPLAVVFLEMPAESLDVNVHPAKTEVRFRSGNRVFGAVQRAVRASLLANGPIPQASHFESLQGSSWAGSRERQSFERRGEDGGLHGQLGLDWSAGSTSDDSDAAATSLEVEPGGGRLPIMRLIGQVGTSYIVTEGPDGLYLLDQHAAHERILYEQFMAAWEAEGDGGMATQGLVTGSAVQLSPAQATLLAENLELLGQIGFRIEPFGPNTFMVRGIPAMLTGLDPARAVMGVVDDLERGETPLKGGIEARIILRVCKSAAVKAGQTLSSEEMEAMISQLESCQNPRTCPHGRPTLIHLSASQLAKEFGRT
jgi:DNA mismatch repair protein MutL